MARLDQEPGNQPQRGAGVRFEWTITLGDLLTFLVGLAAIVAGLVGRNVPLWVLGGLLAIIALSLAVILPPIRRRLGQIWHMIRPHRGKLVIAVFVLMVANQAVLAYMLSAAPWPLDSEHQTSESWTLPPKGRETECSYLGWPDPYTAAAFLVMFREEPSIDSFVAPITDPSRQACVKLEHPVQMRQPFEESGILDYDDTCLKGALAVLDPKGPGVATLAFTFPSALSRQCPPAFFEVTYVANENVVNVTEIRHLPQR